jgi:hypothetical protein
VKILLLLMMAFSFDYSFAQLPAMKELRYCGIPARDEDGSISRSSAVIAEFKRIHPCPVDWKTSGACKGWAIDHVIPLACGGCDAVSNMQWLPNGIKSQAVIGKDRFERRIYQKDIKCE